jgi:hypothetical protein
MFILAVRTCFFGLSLPYPWQAASRYREVPFGNGAVGGQLMERLH